MRKRELILLDEASAFVRSLPVKHQQKILNNIRRVLNGENNRELFKKLEDSDEIWEFRTLFAGIQYRLFAFWDTEENTIIVATHGIIKKTEKTPRKEIEKAERIRREYFAEKRRRLMAQC